MSIIILFLIFGLYIFFIIKEYRRPTMEVSGWTMRSWVHLFIFVIIVFLFLNLFKLGCYKESSIFF